MLKTYVIKLKHGPEKLLFKHNRLGFIVNIIFSTLFVSVKIKINIRSL